MKFLAAWILVSLLTLQSFAADTPNVIIVLADDLGIGHLGCYGQTKIKTPHLDQMAKDGMKFTQCYAGSTVCAPSRCALMTGLHTGHCRVRGNGGLAGKPMSNVPLEPTDATVAKQFKQAGYTTALIGKWGLGEEGSTGVPTKQGFDFFYGYLNQHHAHNYYPDFLHRNEMREALDNPQSKTPNVAAKENVYVPDMMMKETMAFLEANQAKPFFLAFTTTLPHANNEKTRATKNGNEIPNPGIYANQDWPKPEQDLAAMITRLDADVGAIRAKLSELKLTEKTLILFVSDNGPHREGGNDPSFFNASGPFSGIKRSLQDGGIRVPGLAVWPGKIAPGKVSDHIWAFWDVLPTVTQMLNQEPPKNSDGVSFWPTLSGQGKQAEHEFLYWEFHENGFAQAVRHGPWKALRDAPGAALELYDVMEDPKESFNVAKKHPQIVAKIEAYLKTARTDSAEFPIKPGKAKK